VEVCSVVVSTVVIPPVVLSAKLQQVKNSNVLWSIFVGLLPVYVLYSLELQLVEVCDVV